MTISVFLLGTLFGYFLLSLLIDAATESFSSLKGIFEPKSEIETLYLDLDFKSLRELSYNLQVLQQAGEAGLIRRGEFKRYVKANLVHGEAEFRTKIRLKGDKTDHTGLLDGKLSYILQLGGENTVFGMKKFALQHPGTRMYLDSWFFHNWLKREGVLGLRTGFVRLFINGKDLGIYNYEEHFDKRLLEANQRREGPIVRFDEEVMWNPDMYSHNNAEDAERFTRSRVIGFDAENTLESLPGSQINRAILMLDGFRAGEYSTREVFDVDLLARYMAVVTLSDGYHALRWLNLRFYLNPITSKLEPIGFDADPGGLVTHLAHELKYNAIQDRPLFDKLFEDLKLTEAYVRHLDRLTQDKYVEDLFAAFEPELRELERALQDEFESYRFSFANYSTNVERVRSMIHPHTGIDSFFLSEQNDKITLMIGNTQSLPLKVISLRDTQGRAFKLLEPVMLGPKKRLSTIEYLPVTFLKPQGYVAGSQLKVRYHSVGSNLLQEYNVSPWPFPQVSLPDDNMLSSTNGNIEDFEFVVRSGKILHIKSGTWEISEPLIFPPGFVVKGGPGTSLILKNNAYIVSYSPVEFTGLIDEPFQLTAAVGEGQGFAVIKAGGSSILENVLFSGLAAPSRNGWALTGAVTFHQSPVSMRHVHFSDNIDSDDALNLFRSPFTLSNLSFANIASDAIDVDFSDGTLQESSFDTTGNDAIDISGAEVKVNQVTMTNVGDKGVSAGERSIVFVDGLKYDSGNVGIASKDLSNVFVKNTSLLKAKFSIAAYQKKSEFGPGYIALTSPLVFDSEIIKDKDSRIVIDGRNYSTVTGNVLELINVTE